MANYGFSFENPDDDAKAHTVAPGRPNEADPQDYSDQYNTQLTPREETEFEQWQKDHNRTKDTYDYDLRGAWKDTATRHAIENGGHGDDRWKKPNHPTFSTDSQYSTDAERGGKWDHGSGDRWKFTPSAANLNHHDPEELRQYFNDHEPNSDLNQIDTGDLPQDTRPPQGGYGFSFEGQQGAEQEAPVDNGVNRIQHGVGALAIGTGSTLADVPKGAALDIYGPDTDLAQYEEGVQAGRIDPKTHLADMSKVKDKQSVSPTMEQMYPALGIIDPMTNALRRAQAANVAAKKSPIFEPFDAYTQMKFDQAPPEQRDAMLAEIHKQQKEATDSGLYKWGDEFDHWVQDNVWQNPAFKNEFLTDTVPQAFGSTIAFFMPAMIAHRFLPRAMAKPPQYEEGAASPLNNGPWGADPNKLQQLKQPFGTQQHANDFMAAALPGVAVNKAQEFENAIQKGATFTEAYKAADMSLLAGASEGLPIMAFLDRSGIMPLWKKMLVQGSEEFLQESGQNLANALTQHLVYDPETSLWKEINDAGVAGGAGFTTGALMEVLAAILPGKLRHQNNRKTVDALGDQIQEAARQQAEAEGKDQLGQLLAAQNAIVGHYTALDEADANSDDNLERVLKEQTDNETLADMDKVTTERGRLQNEVDLAHQARDDEHRKRIASDIAQAESDQMFGRRSVEERNAMGEPVAEQSEATGERPINPAMARALAAAGITPTEIVRRHEEQLAAEQAAKEQQPAVQPGEQPGSPYFGAASVAKSPNETAEAAPVNPQESNVDNSDDDEGPGSPGYRPKLAASTETAAKEAPTEATAVAPPFGKTPRWVSDQYSREPAIEQTPNGKYRVVTTSSQTGKTTKVHATGLATAAEAEGARAEVQRRLDEHRAWLKQEDAAALKKQQIEAAAREAATSPENDLANPTQAQKEAGNYKKGHVSWNGLDITIENPQGSTRSGTDTSGRSWSQKLRNHYGYIRLTDSAEGPSEHLDTFLGPNPASDRVYVVDQVDQNTGAFDEHKVMAGFDSNLEAIKAYRQNYQKGWKVGRVTEMSVEEFKDWALTHGNKSEGLHPATPKPATVVSGAEVNALSQRAAERRPRRKKGITRFAFAKGEENTPTATKMFDTVRQRWVEIPGMVFDKKTQKWIKSPGQARLDRLTRNKSRELVDAANKAMPLLKARIVRNDALPAALKAAIEREGYSVTGINGLYFNGQVYIFADNMNTPEEVLQNILHEGVAHKGLRVLVGSEAKLNELLDRVYESLKARPDFAELAARYQADLNTAEGQRLATEEYIADIAGRGDTDGVLQRVYTWFRDLLRSMGFTQEWTDGDIRGVLREAARSLQGKSIDSLTVKSEVQMADTGETAEIEIPAGVALRRHDKRVGVIEQLKDCL